MRRIMLTVRIYMRVSTEEQDLTRQERLIEATQQQGFYIAGVYREKISGATEWIKRPELSRLINDLQKGDVVIAESIDRLTRLEPTKALELINAIKDKGAKIQVPEVFDFSLISEAMSANKPQQGQSSHNSTFDPSFLMSDLFNALQEMFLKIAVAIAHDDYNKRRTRQKQGIAKAKSEGRFRGRPPNKSNHKAIIEHRKNGMSYRKIADKLGISESLAYRVWKDFEKQ